MSVTDTSGAENNLQDCCRFYLGFRGTLSVLLSMTKIGEVDTKKETRTRIHVYEDTHAEWKIPDFFSVSRYSDSKHYDSPTFSVAGVSFFFRMYPRNMNHPDGVCFYLKNDISRDFSVEYNFGLKKLDGSVVQLKGGIMKGNEMYCEQTGDVSILEVQRQKPELVPGNILTLTCTLKPETIHSTATTELDNPKELKLRRLDKLSENFKAFFGDKETCDVTLKVQNKEYKAHRSILMARSSVFAANFKHDTLERQTGVITIPDCDPDSFQGFLDYLYSGKLEELSFRNALNLYYTSNKYDVEELKEFCVEYLMQCLTVENVCEIVVFADQYDETQLYKVVQEFFNENSLEIFLIPDWEHLMKKNYRLASKLLTEMSKIKLKK